mgnify:CR=1 FL=1
MGFWYRTAPPFAGVRAQALYSRLRSYAGVRSLQAPRSGQVVAKHFHRAPAQPRHASVLVRDSVALYDGTKLVAVYLTADALGQGGLNQSLDYTPILSRLREVTYNRAYRQSGLLSVDRTFGYSPPNAMRQRPTCFTASLNYYAPDIGKFLGDKAVELDHLYRIFDQARYVRHCRRATGILPKWRLPDSVFTGGVVNKNNALAYHYDAGNVPHGWSVMVTLRDSARGGHLVLPAYGVAFECSHNSVLMFDGQKTMHGVSPIYSGLYGARFSIVYYTRAGMDGWQCR